MKLIFEVFFIISSYTLINGREIFAGYPYGSYPGPAVPFNGGGFSPSNLNGNYQGGMGSVNGRFPSGYDQDYSGQQFGGGYGSSNIGPSEGQFGYGPVQTYGSKRKPKEVKIQGEKYGEKSVFIDYQEKMTVGKLFEEASKKFKSQYNIDIKPEELVAENKDGKQLPLSHVFTK